MFLRHFDSQVRLRLSYDLVDMESGIEDEGKEQHTFQLPIMLRMIELRMLETSSPLPLREKPWISPLQELQYLPQVEQMITQL